MHSATMWGVCILKFRRKKHFEIWTNTVCKLITIMRWFTKHMNSMHSGTMWDIILKFRQMQFSIWTNIFSLDKSMIFMRQLAKHMSSMHSGTMWGGLQASALAAVKCAPPSWIMLGKRKTLIESWRGKGPKKLENITVFENHHGLCRGKHQWNHVRLQNAESALQMLVQIPTGSHSVPSPTQVLLCQPYFGNSIS